jgi:hypothetical protein
MEEDVRWDPDRLLIELMFETTFEEELRQEVKP